MRTKLANLPSEIADLARLPLDSLAHLGDRRQKLALTCKPVNLFFFDARLAAPHAPPHCFSLTGRTRSTAARLRQDSRHCRGPDVSAELPRLTHKLETDL